MRVILLRRIKHDAVHAEQCSDSWRASYSSFFSLQGGRGLKSAPPFRGGDEGEGDICCFTFGPRRMCAENRKMADMAIIGRSKFTGYEPFAVEEIT